MKLSTFFIFVPLVQASSEIYSRNCTEVTSWSVLKDEITSVVGSKNALVLCPFGIKKPSNDKILVTRALNLSCEVPRQCIIRGGGNHFWVRGERAVFSLTGFVLRGATKSAIRVLQPSSNNHIIRDCLFRDNDGSENRVRGGALRLDEGTSVTVASSHFVGNQAVRGGAIYHRGAQLTLESCFLRDNLARIGGAIDVGEEGSKLAMEQCRFIRNSATVTKDGAVNAKDINDVLLGAANSGLDNSECDGIFVAGHCYPFSSSSSTETYLLGDLAAQNYGIRLSGGLSLRLIARAGEPVKLTSPDAQHSKSSLPFHTAPDGAHVFELDDGGWIYTSNSEGDDGTGGVYSLEFDRNGRPRNFIQVLSGTTRNCNGGHTHWGTWVSCEEHAQGQCWQVDPTGRREPTQTVLGGLEGGSFEAFAYAFVNTNRPVFFVTEDTIRGALRRFRPDSEQPLGWSMLEGGGKIDYLEFLPENRFRWTESLSDARLSAYNYYQNCEGIIYHDGELMFVSKVQKELFRLDLEEGTYKVESTLARDLEGGGSFGDQPDEMFTAGDDLIYFTEDGGRTPGVYAYDGYRYVTMLEADADIYKGDETTGLAFSPDGMFFYFCIQEIGFLFQAQRSDGLPFESRRLLKLKYDLGRR
jgi:hypothetical protein